jgi:hypothetical protein
MTSNLKFSLLFILGMGHSGSTLLGRMLGAHPDAICMGEILRLELAIADRTKKCACGALFHECSFWQELLAHLPEGVTRDYENWSPEIFEQIKARYAKQLLVDTSKSRAFRLMSKWKRHRAGFIVMIRDPRGVTRGALSRGGELSDLLKTHLKWIERYMKFARKQPDRCTAVFYEDLIAAPEKELRRVCDFIGLAFDPAMLTPGAQVQHLVRASPSARLKPTADLQQDQRWREELSPEQIDEISRVLGRVPIYRDRYKLS